MTNGTVLILAVLLVMFNYLTPSGNFVVIAPVVEIAPNFSVQIAAIPVKPKSPATTGTVLFQIDPRCSSTRWISSKLRRRMRREDQ